MNFKTIFSLFREGRILPSELSQAEMSFKQAKFDYLNAVFNYIESLLTLKRVSES